MEQDLIEDFNRMVIEYSIKHSTSWSLHLTESIEGTKRRIARAEIECENADHRVPILEQELEQYPEHCYDRELTKLRIKNNNRIIKESMEEVARCLETLSEFEKDLKASNLLFMEAIEGLSEREKLEANRRRIDAIIERTNRNINNNNNRFNYNYYLNYGLPTWYNN